MKTDPRYLSDHFLFFSRRLFHRMGLIQSWNEDEGGCGREQGCAYNAKHFFWNFKKEIQQYSFNTKRRNQESYMQTHAHKGFYPAVQCNYWLGAARQQNLMNNFKIYAIKFEELWKTDVNNVKSWLTGSHLHRELWQILANIDSTGSLLHKIILQVLVFLTPGKMRLWSLMGWIPGGKRERIRKR